VFAQDWNKPRCVGLFETNSHHAKEGKVVEIVITRITLLISIGILLSIIILFASCGGYIGSVLERRQELRDMAARLTSLHMSGGSKNYDFPVEDIINSISDELLQVGHDFAAARYKYGAFVAQDADDCFWFWFQSPDWTRERMYGQAGWLVLSKKDLSQIKFFLEIMN
jgi:hypothetical protein